MDHHRYSLIEEKLGEDFQEDWALDTDSVVSVPRLLFYHFVLHVYITLVDFMTNLERYIGSVT